MQGIAKGKFRTMFRRFAITLCLPLGLAACGVVVEKSTLPEITAPQTSAPQTSVPQNPPTTVESTEADAATEQAATQPDEPVDMASLAPSVTGSIDGLINSIADAEDGGTVTPGPDADADTVTDTGADPGAAEAGQDQAPSLPAEPVTTEPPAIEPPATESPATETPVTADAGQVAPEESVPEETGPEETGPAETDLDEPGSPGDAERDMAQVVGNIIWNIETARQGRAAPPADPVVPVGPDPSLASDALEAAFAMLTRRDQGLSADGFLMPKKAPGIMRIALLVPVSGTHAGLGNELQHGAELALFSLRNRQIELLVFDTAGDRAETAAREAVQAEADIIVGPLFSDAVVPARRVAAQTGVPMLALSNNTEIAADGSWLLGYVPEQQVDLLLGHALTTGRDKVGIIAASDDFGQRLARHARKRLAQFGLAPEAFITLTPQQLADEDELKAAARGFTGYVPPAKGEDAPAASELPPPRFDAVLFAGSADFALRTAPVLAYYDADPERVLYLGNAQWNQRRILMEPSLQGGLFTSRPTGRDEAFNALWASAWDGRPGALARLSFDAMAMAAILVGQQPGQWNASLQSGSGFNGFSGAYRLLPGGGNQRAFEIRQISGGVSSVLQPAPDKI